MTVHLKCPVCERNNYRDGFKVRGQFCICGWWRDKPKEETMKKILFFPNGNTAVLDQEQIPDLQKSWAILFAEFLESKGEDPTEFELNFPTYRTARFFRTDDGWNWRFDP